MSTATIFFFAAAAAAAVAGGVALAIWWNGSRPERPSKGGRRGQRHVRDKPPRRHPARAAIGAAVALAAIGAGALVTDVVYEALPEQRGVGLITWAKTAGDLRQVEPAPGRGMALSAAVRVRSCGEPVDVTLFASGTAEFWLDHERELRRGGRISLAIPDLDIEKVGIALGSDAKIAATAPLAEPASLATPLRADVRRRTSVTVVTADVPDWARHLRPVRVSFEADWLTRRTVLGSCYLRLPALAGFPTVLSAREIRGQAVADIRTVDCPCSIFTVGSAETGLEAYYEAQYEITRGVTALDTGGNTLRTDLSRPAPDGNVGGAPSWSCSAKAGHTVDTPDFADPKRPPDILELDPDPSGHAPESRSGAWAARRLGTAATASTCASFAVVEHGGVAVTDSIAGLLVGALFSLGLGLFLEGTRRSQPD